MAERRIIVHTHMSQMLEMKDQEIEDLAAQTSTAATAEVLVGSAQHPLQFFQVSLRSFRWRLIGSWAPHIPS